MNVPNTLTLSRLVLAIVMMVLLTMTFPFSKSLALVVFVIAAITDYFDGYLARKVYGESAFGKLMDPLTDKVLVCAAFVSFVELRLVPAWLVVVIISREFLVTGLRLLAANKGTVIPAGQWGKHKMVWQLVAVIALLLGLAVRYDLMRHASATLLANFDLAFGYVALAISIAVALITVGSGMMYFMQHRELISRHM